MDPIIAILPFDYLSRGDSHGLLLAGFQEDLVINHRHNYSDLPVFDLLFGTFVNPKSYEHKAGFYSGSSDRVKDMLLFKNISTPARAEASHETPKAV